MEEQPDLRKERAELRAKKSEARRRGNTAVAKYAFSPNFRRWVLTDVEEQVVLPVPGDAFDVDSTEFATEGEAAESETETATAD